MEELKVYYENCEGGVRITDMPITLDEDDLEIPSDIFDKKVVSLGPDFLKELECSEQYFDVELAEGLLEICDNAFRNTAIAEIDLPETLQTIGNSAFEGCRDLNTILLTEGVKSIGTGCFMGSALTEFSSDYSMIKEISSFAFACCPFLEFVSLHKSLKVIRVKAFFNCVKLKKIRIPYGTKIIETDAFENCSALSDIYIPSSVTKIGNNDEDNIFLCDGHKNENLIIHCADKSYAKKYAIKNGIRYELKHRKNKA